MDKSVFFHFTSEASLLIARRVGIREGIIPLRVVPDPKNLKRNELKAMNRIVWITRNSEFISLRAEVGPAKSSMLPGRKAQYRLTIKIPKEYLSNIVPWPTFARALKAGFNGSQRLDPKIEFEINTDIIRPEQWFIFGDFIPWAWVTKVDRNPSMEADQVSIQTAPPDPAAPKPLLSFPKLDIPKK